LKADFKPIIFSMENQQAALDFFEELQHIEQQERLNLADKYSMLRSVLDRLCKEQTRQETLQFSTLFSRIVFLGNRFRLSGKLQWELQQLRRNAYKMQQGTFLPEERHYKNAIKALIQAIACFYETAPPRIFEASASEQGSFPLKKEQARKNHIDKLRVQIVKILPEENTLLCRLEDNSEEEAVSVLYNQEFNESIAGFWEGAQLNLIDVYIDQESRYIPTLFVLEPDYLMDISAIAECYQRNGIRPALQLKRKFEPMQSTPAILLGNLANYFLDELIHDKAEEPLTFKELFPKTFQLYPMEFTTMRELAQVEEFKLFQGKAFRHFVNIKRVVQEDFRQGEQPVRKEECILEPSFFSERYGLQGRLDILHKPENEKQGLGIIELKSSGSVPHQGSWKNHEAQALLYRLLLQEVFPAQIRNTNPVIFYSSPEHQNLRFTPAMLLQEKELINLRNLLIITEHRLAYAQSLEEVEEILSVLQLKDFENEPSFIRESIRHFEDTLRHASRLEKNYFLSFIPFIAREHLLAKIGDCDYDSSKGMASLWQMSLEEKKEAFNILYDLKITGNEVDAEKPMITFNRTNPENQFTNFREGDVCVLYPRKGLEDSVLQNQVIKCNIAEISAHEVKVRFRHKQQNREYFEQHESWALEHDTMDNSFNAMYRSLFSFLECPDRYKKELLLGQLPPFKPAVKPFQGLSEEQNRILGKALQAKDYFLLCGPPGTGKTSIMLKTLCRELYQNSKQNILLLAYTNRAVDEICEAVDQAITEGVCPKRKFIRIGSELSTAHAYRHTLLSKAAEEAGSRKELSQYLQKHRIYIGTLASLMAKPELFQLKKFQVAIIDEASQILEPQIIGLLRMVDKHIMIGDHKQLPAISQQNPELARVDDPELNRIGLKNRSYSYFERMFRLCQQHNWHWAYDMLTHQGRMHQELADFSNQAFYGGKLKLIPADWQLAPLLYPQADRQDKLQALLSSKRLLFVPSEQSPLDKSAKVNTYEAQLIARMIKSFVELKNRHEEKDAAFSPSRSVGVITPFRNQAAHIRMELEKHGIPEHEQIVVDTVERYQGSQREIIFISFCANAPHQLRSLISEVYDEHEQAVIDRKLNVSITRARQQMVFIGNEEVLSRNATYQRLIQWVKTRQGYVEEGAKALLEL
jgi:DNA replication ATP-dependent helicase Dna2